MSDRQTYRGKRHCPYCCGLLRVVAFSLTPFQVDGNGFPDRTMSLPITIIWVLISICAGFPMLSPMPAPRPPFLTVTTMIAFTPRIVFPTSSTPTQQDTWLAATLSLMPTSVLYQLRKPKTQCTAWRRLYQEFLVSNLRS